MPFLLCISAKYGGTGVSHVLFLDPFLLGQKRITWWPQCAAAEWNMAQFSRTHSLQRQIHQDQPAWTILSLAQFTNFCVSLHLLRVNGIDFLGCHWLTDTCRCWLVLGGGLTTTNWLVARPVGHTSSSSWVKYVDSFSAGCCSYLMTSLCTRPNSVPAAVGDLYLPLSSDFPGHDYLHLILI